MGFFSKLKSSWNDYDADLKFKADEYIETHLQWMRKTEMEMVQKDGGANLGIIQKMSGNNASEFEKVVLYLTILRQHYLKHGVSNRNFAALFSHCLDKYANSDSRSRIQANFGDAFDFLNERLDFYQQEIELLLTMEHPHPGAMVYKIYDAPLQKADSMNQSTIVGQVFTTVILHSMMHMAQKFEEEVFG
jgi:hypothetical protein